MMRHFAKYQQNTVIEYIKGIIGGFIMGLGGMMSYGCNMGALVGGITSSSVHGFIWFFCAILGAWTIIGVEKCVEGKRKRARDYMAIDSLRSDVGAA
jgi:uncharacterized membrane protein YedE/YeeE